jgi:putative ABC transport system permease protein
VSPVLQGRLILQGHEEQRLQLMGIEPVSLPAGAAVAGQALAIEQIVGFFTAPGSTWISPQTLQALGLSEGARPLAANGQMPPLHAQGDMAPGCCWWTSGSPNRFLDCRISCRVCCCPRASPRRCRRRSRGNFSSRPLAKKTIWRA